MSLPVFKQTLPAEDNVQAVLNQTVQSASSEKKQKISRNKWLKFGLRLGCTIVILAFLLRSISWSVIFQKIMMLDEGALLMSIMMGFLGVVLSSYQWQSLLDGENIRLDLRHLINLYFVGIAFNHFLPTGMGGDVVKAYYVGKEGKNTTGSASAVVMSRITGFVGMLFVSVPALLIWHHQFTGELTLIYLLSCLGMCIALAAIYLSVTRLQHFIPRKWQEKRLVGSLLSFGETLKVSMRQPRSICTAILFGMFFHVGAALNYYGYATALDLNTPFAFYMVAVPLISLIAFLPISINGFGMREGACLSILATIHVAKESALLLVLLIDAQMLLFGVIGGLIYLFINGSKKPNISKEAQVQTQKLQI